MAVKLISVILALSIIIPFAVYFCGKKTFRRGKATLVTNIATFFTTLVLSTVYLFANGVSAAEEATAAVGAYSVGSGLGFLAAALVTGLSTIGAGIAVAAASTTAIGAISEDSKLMGKSMIFVALAEGIALYGLLVSFSILAKL